MLTAQDLHERAVAHGNAGRHALAARTLTRAAERTEDPDLVARIAGTRAYLLAETGDPDQALALCREALAAPGLSRRTRALLVSQVGLVELRRGDLDAALEHLTAATGALADDPARLGRVLLNRGLAHLDHGQVLRAERDFGAAAEQLELAGEVVEEAKARHNQGYAALVRGDLVRALRLMERAREDLVGLSPVTLAVCDLDRAAVLTAAGETTEAVRLLTAVAHVFGTRRLRQAQADAELALAGALLGTDATAAGAVARRAARRYRARGNALGAARADACALTAEVLGGPGRADQGGAGPGRARPGRVEDLAARLDASSAELAARGLTAEVTALRLQRARLDLRTGRPADAAGRLRRLRVTTRAPVLVRVLAREVRAEVAAAQGVPRRVLAHAAAGLDELETWQAASGSVDLQSGLAVHGRVLVLEGIRAAVSTRDPARVLEWSERARGLASRVAALRPPSDPATAADLTELRRLRLLGTPGADPGGRRDAQQREAGLRDAVRRRAWEREGHGVVGTVPRLDDVVPALASTEADLVTYLWSGDRLTALVVSGRAHVVDLGPWAPVRGLLDGLLADLDAAGADLPGPLAAVVAGALDERLARLDAALGLPVGPLLRRGRAVLTVPGVLAGVPWDALGTFRDRSLTRPTSVGRWLEQGHAPGPPRRAGFAAGPDVPRAAQEVRAAAAAWAPHAVVLDVPASTEAVAAVARSVDVLHVAAHGRHSPDNPLFSGLELGDGPWFGYDVDRLDGVPAVVVLSACELGRSAQGWGREALGMAQAWLHAGARCVVAAGSAVNDAVAGDLLAEVHRRLARGRAPSDALREATGALGVRTSFAVHGAGW